ncbi:MAG: hypothetical protein ACYC1B_04705, partial [Thermoleophilia bacterium]
ASGDVGAGAAALVEAANGAGGEDNVTVVLFSPDGAMPSGATPDPASENRGRTASAAASSGLPWWRRWQALAAVSLALVIVLAGSSWYLTRQLYYLGVSDGRLSIYQGLPVELGPLSLSSLYRQSDLPLEDLEPFEQERVLRQELSSLATAEETLKNYADRNQPEPDRDRGARTATTSTGVEF